MGVNLSAHASARTGTNTDTDPRAAAHVYAQDTVRENNAQRSTCFTDTRIGTGCGNTLGTKGAQKVESMRIGTVRRESGIPQAQERSESRTWQRCRKELRANVERHRCAIQTPSPLAKKKKENRGHGLKTKSEENSPRQKCIMRGLSAEEAGWWRACTVNERSDYFKKLLFRNQTGKWEGRWKEKKTGRERKGEREYGMRKGEERRGTGGKDERKRQGE
ncbi:hypothetical protein B0H13DRAFT_1904061 [Mycena leptocephala]|nr:hypothetical protein B0H13DRAFT_1904061 [Mycena leptocephala]